MRVLKGEEKGESESEREDGKMRRGEGNHKGGGYIGCVVYTRGC